MMEYFQKKKVIITNRNIIYNLFLKLDAHIVSVSTLLI